MFHIQYSGSKDFTFQHISHMHTVHFCILLGSVFMLHVKPKDLWGDRGFYNNHALFQYVLSAYFQTLNIKEPK